MTSLYLHIPFCRRKCGYCDFYSVAADETVRGRYAARLAALLRDAPRALGGDAAGPFGTVYFGGGTPPLLGAGAIAGLLDAARDAGGIAPGAEITLECNPESVDKAFLAAAARAGVNRLSVGLQSAHAGQLRRLGRAHRAEDAARTVESARAAGIANVSLDVMLALPGQTEESLKETLSFCLSLGVPHVSAYLLGIEPGTRFWRERVWEQCPGEDGQAELYLTAVERLEAAGLRRYEISNFARPGFESRHNRAYWTLAPYLGLGPAAHSLVNGVRRSFPRDLGAFLGAPDPWALLADDGPGGGAEEWVMLRLRLREGLPLSEARRAGADPDELLRRAAPLERAGLLTITPERIALTLKGCLVSNAVIARLLD